MIRKQTTLYQQSRGALLQKLYVPTAVLFIVLLVSTACQKPVDSAALDGDIAKVKQEIEAVKGQMTQYRDLAPLEALVRARYLILLQTRDMLEQRRAAKIYDINLTYTAQGGETRAVKSRQLDRENRLERLRSDSSRRSACRVSVTEPRAQHIRIHDQILSRQLQRRRHPDREARTASSTRDPPVDHLLRRQDRLVTDLRELSPLLVRQRLQRRLQVQLSHV